MTLRRLLLPVLMVWVLIGSTARAHFLFVRLRPPAEAGRFAEVYFSEQAGAGDPRFVQTVAADLFNEKLTADTQGQATWKVPYRSNFSVYVSRVTKETGEHNGRKYQEVREFATLAFTWPLVAKDADPQAVKLFEEALAS